MKKHYSNFNNSLFYNLDKYFSQNKKRQIFLTNECYKIWLENFSLKKHKQIIKMTEKFIESGHYMISQSY